MRHERREGEVKEALARLRETPEADSERVAAHRAAFLKQARRYRNSVAPRQGILRRALSGARSWGISLSRRPSMAHLAVIAAILFATLAGGGGVAYAADAAGPGDPLYGIDRAVESVQLALTSRAQRPALLLKFAEERLEEAGALSGAENASRREAALNGWGETLSGLATSVAGPQGLDQDALAATIDEALSRQQGHLSQMLDEEPDPEKEDEVEDDEESDFCDPESELKHPAAEGLADAYSVDYATVEGWFCDGYGIGQIMLALETVQLVDGEEQDLETLLEEAASEGWGQVWQRLGLIGKPEDAGPPEDVPAGKPEDAGPPDVPVGKPDDPGPPDDQAGGKPDHAGPPVEVPRGKPDDVGPPVDPPKGPPGEVPPVDPPEGPPVDPPEGPPSDPPGDDPPPVEPPEEPPVDPPEVPPVEAPPTAP
jgi:hypothetical protein